MNQYQELKNAYQALVPYLHTGAETSTESRSEFSIRKQDVLTEIFKILDGYPHSYSKEDEARVIEIFNNPFNANYFDGDIDGDTPAVVTIMMLRTLFSVHNMTIQPPYREYWDSLITKYQDLILA